MTTYFGESSSDARYYLRPYTMSASVAAKASARASNTVLMAPESSPVDGLEESRVIHYSTLQAFGAAVQQLKNCYARRAT